MPSRDVYKSLKKALPHESFVYFGDTAHLPYGSKSPDAVRNFALDTKQLIQCCRRELI